MRIRAVAAALFVSSGISTAALGAADTTYTLRVGNAVQCPSEPKPKVAPIVAAILTSVVSQAVSSLVDLVAEELTKDGGTKLTAQAPVNALLTSRADVVKFAPQVTCLWVAAAQEFADDKEIGDAQLIVPFVDNVPDEDLKTQVAKQTGARSPIVFYFEGKVVTSSDNSAWRIEPQRLDFPRFISQASFWQNSARRDVQFAVEWSEPGKEATPFATMKLDFIGVTASEVTLSHLGKNPLLWMSVPNVTAPKKDIDFFPVNVKAQVVETTHPYKLATYIGNALKAQKEAIAKEATDRLTLAISAQARNTAQLGLLDLAEKAYTAYTTAYDAVVTAVSDYSKATDPAAKLKAKNSYVSATAVLKQRETAVALAYSNAGLAFEALPVPPLP